MKCLQKYLQTQGYYKGCNIDGQYGPYTQSAVKAYQKAKGLVQDGYAGPITTAKMGLNCQSQTTTPAPSMVQACWKRCPDIDFDGQDNGYQCACAAFSMATATLKRKIAETNLAKIFGTTTAGTGQSQVISGLDKLGFKGTPFNVTNMSVQTLANLVGSSDHGVCAHIQLKDAANWKQSMVYDYQGKKLYQTFRGGHWEFISAVDPCRGIVLMGDPARGMQYVLWEQLWYATRYNEQMNLGSGFVVVTQK